jgi:hypothetical protein
VSTAQDCTAAFAASADDDSADLSTALAALRGNETRPAATSCRSRRSSHRALLGLALCGLLIGGVFALRGADQDSRPAAAGTDQVDDVYLSAHPGSCLVWQPDEPDRLSFAQCATPHMFEVAGSFNGGDTEPCDLTVRKYLGARFDPNSKFATTELTPTGHPAEGSRRRLCGLQLPGPDGHPVPFRGLVADTDQSKMWPPGTCLGIDPRSSRPSDVAVDCAAPHAVEVVGAVDLGTRFHSGTPTDAEQTAALEDSCAQLAATYLAPRSVASTGLKVIQHAIGPSSWAAGSRHATCSLGPQESGPITGRAATHHRAVEETIVTPTQPAAGASGAESTQPAPAVASTHAPQSAETQSAATVSPPVEQAVPEPVTPAAGGPGGISQVPAGPQGPAHEVVQIPGLAPVTVPAMPDEPAAAPVPLGP